LPVGVVTVLYCAPDSEFLAVTLAFGITAFAGSEIVPVMVPRSLWPNTAREKANSATKRLILTSSDEIGLAGAAARQIRIV
jgi:hypothetical protein